MLLLHEQSGSFPNNSDNTEFTQENPHINPNTSGEIHYTKFDARPAVYVLT